jgi:hypothetical protein
MLSRKNLSQERAHGVTQGIGPSQAPVPKEKIILIIKTKGKIFKYPKQSI